MTMQLEVRLFIHVEEPSMGEALKALLPSLLIDRQVSWRIIDHGSKQALLKALPDRMKAYARWPEPSWRVLVLVDRDNDDCKMLKTQIESAAIASGLATKTTPDHAGYFRVLNRIVVEELEAWFVGDVSALVGAFPKVPSTFDRHARFRDPDAITGGTWEALHNLLSRAGYYAGSRRMPKIEVARRIAPLMDRRHNKSKSFQAFVTGLDALLS